MSTPPSRQIAAGPGRPHGAAAPASGSRRPDRGPDLGADRPGGGRAAAWVPVLLAAAAVVYNDWVLEFLLPTGLDARHSYVSELYAADQPFHVLFGWIEVAAAALVVTAALLARPLTAGRWARAGRWSLIAFGISSVADVVVPMHCAPSVEHPCEAVNPWHTTTSALVHAALFGSMFFLVVAARTDRPRLAPIARWGPRTLAAALAAALATVGPLFGRPGWHGVPQRTHLVLVGVWFLLLAGSLRAEARPRER
ncbi:DUF998 domain-containing protein [Streptomyces sp. NPDC049577]|uniref:DUF998 domain-containing protein n=1 Tax=Streptomyces sp. NPDC049577 TaxID=3155153 RepID=UPI0034134527